MALPFVGSLPGFVALRLLNGFLVALYQIPLVEAVAGMRRLRVAAGDRLYGPLLLAVEVPASLPLLRLDRTADP